MNEKWSIQPYSQIGYYRFGMLRKEAQMLRNETFQTFMSGFPEKNQYIDDYGEIQVLYTKENKLEAVLLVPPFDIEYGGATLSISDDAVSAIYKLKLIVDDLKYYPIEDSYYSAKIGMVVYCPEGEIESVLFHRKHYFDEENKYLKEHFGTTRFSD